MKELWSPVIVFYVIIAIFTFGHAAAGTQRWQDTHCQTAEARIASNERCYSGPAVNGVFAGVFWPLYWSWEMWS